MVQNIGFGINLKINKFVNNKKIPGFFQEGLSSAQKVLKEDYGFNPTNIDTALKKDIFIMKTKNNESGLEINTFKNNMEEVKDGTIDKALELSGVGGKLDIDIDKSIQLKNPETLQAAKIAARKLRRNPDYTGVNFEFSYKPNTEKNGHYDYIIKYEKGDQTELPGKEGISFKRNISANRKFSINRENYFDPESLTNWIMGFAKAINK